MEETPTVSTIRTLISRFSKPQVGSYDRLQNKASKTSPASTPKIDVINPNNRAFKENTAIFYLNIPGLPAEPSRIKTLQDAYSIPPTAKEKSKTSHKTLTDGDQPSSLVNKLKIQFEQQSTLQKPSSEGINPDQASTLRKPNITRRNHINFETRNRNDCKLKATENQRVSFSTSLSRQEIASRPIQRLKAIYEAKPYTDTVFVDTNERGDKNNNQLHEAFNVKAQSLIIDDEQTTSGDEFYNEFGEKIDDRCESPCRSSYGNAGISTQDLPKLPTYEPRTRASFAEARSAVLTKKTQLKQSVSFNQNSQIKNQKDHGELKCDKLDHIINELINTEEAYVRNLSNGMKNYGNMFARDDLPLSLQGKEFHLFGPIDRIILFHRDVLLPMFRKNRNDLTKLFEEFLRLVQNHQMYDYVLYTMNKRRCLDIVAKNLPYLTFLQKTIGEELGIQAFLLQPIQRLPRYSLLLGEMIKTFFVAGIRHVAVKACCALDKGISRLLDTANEATNISDIVDWSSLNLTNPLNKFQKVLDLYVFDFDRDRSYASKVFIFDKCMIYTEILANNVLIYRGGYDALLKIDLIATKNSFRMSQHDAQVVELRSNSPEDLERSLKFIKSMIASNSDEVTTRKNSVDMKSARTDSGVGLDF